MSSRRNLQREVRNGKAVYVPQSARMQLNQDRSSSLHPHKFGIRLARLLVLGSFGTIASLLWLSAEYLSNPDFAFWLDYGLPGVTRRHSSGEQPLKLSKIQSVIKAEGLFAGEPIPLQSNATLQFNLGTTADIAIPVFKQDASKGADDLCTQNCRSIQQLRIYRALQLPLLIRIFQSDPYFRRTDIITVQGPSESDLRSVDNNPLVSFGSEQSLPLTQSDLYDPAPRPGQWLRLVGLQNQGSSVSTYGQIYYFNPRLERLELMLNWVSPLGEIPQWQQVTGDGKPELVINQTVGVEPQYKVYQIELADGVASQLQPILLNDPAFENAEYFKALTLARSRLWTPAQALLKQVKQYNPKSWNAVAQSQLDLIQLHARVAQAQAAQSSASGVQRILAYLVNGSWSTALDVMASDRSLRPELREMLLSDSGSLANRIDTALKAAPGDSDIVAWGALLRLSQGSPEDAITWTQKQAKGNPATLMKVQKLIKEMKQPLADGTGSKPKPQAKLKPSSAASSTTGSATSTPAPAASTSTPAPATVSGSSPSAVPSTSQPDQIQSVSPSLSDSPGSTGTQPLPQ